MSKQKANHLAKLANEMKKAGVISSFEYSKIINTLKRIGGGK